MTIQPVQEPPCPCFLYEDDGTDQGQCECSAPDGPHSFEDHEQAGPSVGACRVGHIAGCPLDHGDTPCPTGQDRDFQELLVGGTLGSVQARAIRAEGDRMRRARTGSAR